jgi:hypothetical protein
MATYAARSSSPQTSGNPVEEAVQALAERAKVFTEASEALRAEILAFKATLAKAEGHQAEPALKLVVSRETAEMEAIDEAKAAGESGETDGGVPAAEYRPTPAQIAEFFRHGAPEGLGPEPASAQVMAPTESRERNLARERLYADIGGAVIGLSAAAALLNFVLLK